jgi:hypothetical protein
MFRGLGRGIVSAQTMQELKGIEKTDSKLQSSAKPVTFDNE